MAKTVSVRRWSSVIQSVAALVAIAIIARFAPSANAHAESYTVSRQSSAVQAAQVVAHHGLSRRPGKVASSSAPRSAPLSAGRAITSGAIRESSRGGITPSASAALTCYDATAPPGLLLT